MKNILLFALMFPFIGLFGQKWEKNYDFVDNCNCGLSKVGKDGKVGYVDKNGNEIIKPVYADGLTFTNGLVAVKKDLKWMFLDSTGTAVTDAVFDYAMSFDSSGMAPVEMNGLYGYIGRNGKMAIECRFNCARNFSEGLAPASNSRDLWGYINTAGEWIIKPQYNFADVFSGNEARVMQGIKIFYIDKKNKMLHE